jgi:hypothetical protein
MYTFQCVFLLLFKRKKIYSGFIVLILLNILSIEVQTILAIQIEFYDYFPQRGLFGDRGDGGDDGDDGGVLC